MITASPSLPAFWEARRAESPALPEEVPLAWAFGATPGHADGLLDLVLRGIKDGTASSMWDYEATGDPLPEVGELSVVLDGEGDRTLEHWRAVHERYWREHSENPKGFAPDMPVLSERFRLLWPAARSDA